MGFYDPRTLEIAPGLAVETQYHGEHHMGAETVEIRLPFALEGHKRFFFTNGSVLLSADRKALLLHDAVIVLRVDLASRECAHAFPPPGWYIAELDSALQAELYGHGSERRAHAFEGAQFMPGLGPLSAGWSSSAYLPAVKPLL